MRLQASSGQSPLKCACSVHRDHNVGGLDQQADAVVAELVDGLVGDRGRQDISVDANMRSSRAFLDFDHDAPDVVRCTDAHVALSTTSVALGACDYL